LEEIYEFSASYWSTDLAGHIDDFLVAASGVIENSS
jgi:hypothetical protein